MPPLLPHVETYGDADAPAVLAVHGITGFGARFGRLAALVPERRWLCPDLRGHGRTAPLAPWRTEEHVADLLTVLDSAGIDEVDVVGHSFGGHVALHLLAAAPERVRRLVLLDPASLSDPAAAAEKALDYARDPGWSTEAEARAEIDTWFPSEGSRPDFELECTHNLVCDEAGRWRMRFSPVVIVAAYGEMARPLPDPMPSDVDGLLVEADPSMTTVSDHLRSALRSCFGDRLAVSVVPNATHVLFRTELEATAAAVRPFLAGGGA